MTDQHTHCPACHKAYQRANVNAADYRVDFTAANGQVHSHMCAACWRNMPTQAPQAAIAVHLTPNDKNNPPGKLADAEIHFLTGPLQGSKLIGFAIWERRTGGGRNVTFPARQYSVNGERRSFALLRPVADSTASDRTREMILSAYARYEYEPTNHTRAKMEFDQDGRQLTPPATSPSAPADQSYAGPKDLCAEHADQPTQAQGCTNIGAQDLTTNEPTNPGILLGSMIVEAIYGPPAQPSPLESSPDAAEAWSIDARMAEAAAQRQTSAAPKVRRF